MTMFRYLAVLPALLLAIPLTAFADDDDDDDDRYERRYGRESKQTFYDGNCKIERKFKKNGDFKEERKCKGPRYGAYQPAPVYAPAPIFYRDSGVVIQGTFVLPR